MISLWGQPYNVPPFTSLHLPFILVSHHSAQVLNTCFTVYCLTPISQTTYCLWVIAPVVVMRASAYNKQMHHSYLTVVGVRRGTWLEDAVAADHSVCKHRLTQHHRRGSAKASKGPFQMNCPQHTTSHYISAPCTLHSYVTSQNQGRKDLFFSFMNKISIFNMTQ